MLTLDDTKAQYSRSTISNRNGYGLLCYSLKEISEITLVRSRFRLEEK